MSGQFFQRAFGIANKFIDFLLWDANDDSGACDTAADSDATGVRPDLSMGSRIRREEGYAQCCNEEMTFHGVRLTARAAARRGARALGSCCS